MRVGTTVNGTTSNYLWDRQATYPQLIDDGTYAYLHNAGPLAQIDGSGNRTYMLTDALHSVRGLVDGAGALVGTTEYAAFGALRSQTGMTSSMGFTGELFSAATGLLHLRARDLMPNLARFLSADTIQPNAPGTMGYNLYAYAANNPATWVDPSGHAVGAGLLLPTLGSLCAGASLLCLLMAIFALLAILLAIILLYSTLPYTGPIGSIDDSPVDTTNADPDEEPDPVMTPAPPIWPVDDNDEDKRRIFISGINHREVTSHISTAIFFGAPPVLHKLEEAHPRDWWYQDRNMHYESPYSAQGNPCYVYKNVANIAGIDCDEYPFGIAREGGESNRPSLRAIGQSVNRSHGNALAQFFRVCNVKPDDDQGGEFEVKIDWTGATRPHCPEYGINGGLY